MVDDDVLFGFRLRLFSLAAELGNVRAGVPDLRASTPRPTTAGGARSCARASRCSGRGSAGHPGCPTRRASSSSSGSSPSPRPPGSRTAAHQRHPRPGALGRHRHQPQRRLAGAPPARPVAGASAGCRLVAGYAAPPGPERPTPARGRHVEVDHPGELVGFDCFHVGRLGGHERAGSGSTPPSTSPRAYVWAELHTTPLNPSARERPRPWPGGWRPTSRAHGWRLERVLTDNGSEFRSSVFGDTLRELGATQTFIRAGRPATNGAVERVQRTILEECWRPSFARSLVPKLTGLDPRPRGLPALLQRRSVPTPVG